MWAQLRPAEHETGVFPGVLPRLRVAFVFPTQTLGHEGLALRCNGNKSPNHLISSRSQGQGIPFISFPAACPPRGTPPAQRAELLSATISRGLCLEREPACQLPVAVSVGATDQGRGMAWPCGLPQLVDADGWRATKVTAMAFCSRTTHQRWLAGPSPRGPGMMAVAGVGAGRDCRRLDPS